MPCNAGPGSTVALPGMRAACQRAADGAGQSAPRDAEAASGWSRPRRASSRRTLVLPEALVGQLRSHRLTQTEQRLRSGPHWHAGLDLIFPAELGLPMDPSRDRRAWKKLLAAAGVRDVRLHDARHTAATLLLVQGVDLRTVMSIMGWTEMATAQRYSHAVDELRVEAARRMGGALWPTSPDRGTEVLGSVSPGSSRP